MHQINCFRMSTFKIVLVLVLGTVEVFSQVAVFPTPDYVAIPGGDATFRCLSLSGERLLSIEWFIDGRPAQESNLTALEFFSIGGSIGILEFPEVSMEYDKTSVQSRAMVEGGGFMRSEPAYIRVQGPPGAVTNLTLVIRGSTIFLTWEAPDTLDITGVDPDLSYHIEVIDATSGVQIYPAYDVLRTEFNYNITAGRTCDEIMFNVTSKNVAGNGSVATVSCDASSLLTTGTDESISTVFQETVSSSLTSLPSLSAPVMAVLLLGTNSVLL